jgi:hypothetical protein
MGVAGLVLGIISVTFCWLPYVYSITLLLAIVGIALSAVGRRRSASESKPAGTATAGLVLNIIGLTFSLLSIGCYVLIGSSNNEVKQSVQPPPDPRSQMQKDFESTVAEYAIRFDRAANEIQESQIRAARKQAIQDLNMGRQISEWYGTMDYIGTNSDGSAYIKIKLNNDLTLSTWNNALSDRGDNTMIEVNTELYNKIGLMKKGQKVVFSGSFFPSDQDTIREHSLTIYGSMKDPDFLFKFSDVELVK